MMTFVNPAIPLALMGCDGWERLSREDRDSRLQAILVCKRVLCLDMTGTWAAARVLELEEGYQLVNTLPAGPNSSRIRPAAWKENVTLLGTDLFLEEGGTGVLGSEACRRTQGHLHRNWFRPPCQWDLLTGDGSSVKDVMAAALGAALERFLPPQQREETLLLLLHPSTPEWNGAGAALEALAAQAAGLCEDRILAIDWAGCVWNAVRELPGQKLPRKALVFCHGSRSLQAYLVSSNGQAVLLRSALLGMERLFPTIVNHVLDRTGRKPEEIRNLEEVLDQIRMACVDCFKRYRQSQRYLDPQKPCPVTAELADGSSLSLTLMEQDFLWALHHEPVHVSGPDGSLRREAYSVQVRYFCREVLELWSGTAEICVCAGEGADLEEIYSQLPAIQRFQDQYGIAPRGGILRLIRALSCQNSLSKEKALTGLFQKQMQLLTETAAEKLAQFQWEQVVLPAADQYRDNPASALPIKSFPGFCRMRIQTILDQEQEKLRLLKSELTITARNQDWSKLTASMDQALLLDCGEVNQVCCAAVPELMELLCGNLKLDVLLSPTKELQYYKAIPTSLRESISFTEYMFDKYELKTQDRSAFRRNLELPGNAFQETLTKKNQDMLQPLVKARLFSGNYEGIREAIMEILMKAYFSVAEQRLAGMEGRERYEDQNDL